MMNGCINTNLEVVLTASPQLTVLYGAYVRGYKMKMARQKMVCVLILVLKWVGHTQIYL